MGKVIYHVGKDELQEIFALYAKQTWLYDREDRFLELLLLCDNKDHKKLVRQLLSEFHFLDNETLGRFLNDIANYIITKSGFSMETTQVAAITYDDEADSSQKVLDYIKMPLFVCGWDNFKSVNRFGAVAKNFNRGRNQIIFIDEFVGSGRTILGRIKQLKSDIREKFELKFCFIAGMEHGIKKIEAEGYEVFCPLRLSKGISEKYLAQELDQATASMRDLELKLAQKVEKFDLAEYSFGHGGAEALYSLEGCQGNTPNSVFPVFWWPRLADNVSRETLLTRFERGLK